MSTSSVRSTVISSIFVIASMGFASGGFLMWGVSGLARGNWWYFIGGIAVTLLSILAIVLHAKRIISQIAMGPSRETKTNEP
jgi:hypothetical protein